MKTRLRKIIVNDTEYLYLVKDQYHPGTETNTLTVKIFLIGQKQTPLVINFMTRDHYIVGQPLKSGVELMNTITNVTENINLNEPKYIRQLIIVGQKNGWTGNNVIELQSGISYLLQLGFETDQLL
ncbi:hypothetical protein C1637_22540 [Chryseobacterium lactis]|uniref:Uncharacterized protein n=1 Tax=Chryseobacterium lactis TaxID=1241981 RepID=A0A3G6RUA4_CHRLC|nr:hypothetical protein [Chryseobacterium lactis]AZA80542.1 hypothetical protein EG342_00795 [Chryseobacterium lactis]AZB05544.1 hypothetical protein EG341_16920 [Chryseobacterium lactis]PNW11322.1 hypothetical protein C1637_22540 [Chryseobacterium lactis]